MSNGLNSHLLLISTRVHLTHGKAVFPDAFMKCFLKPGLRIGRDCCGILSVSSSQVLTSDLKINGASQFLLRTVFYIFLKYS